MRSLFLLSAFFLNQSFSFIDAVPGFIDPTGTYILTGTIKNNRITGHSGEIRVQLLGSHQIALCFYITKGYPAYESGSFMDTLAYDDSTARYYPGKDSCCTILFYFHLRGVEIMEIYTDPHLCYGFANGVLISAVFKKTSADKPIIQDLSNHGMSP
ncbi:MAG TPA: hypothetical protein VNS58_22165 [Puia sp.]|nr:hypothetical protein [Puia sp.]